jgi:hypothetical protein
MAKAGELDWSELSKSKVDYTHAQSSLWVNDPKLGVAPKGDAKPILAKGEVPLTPSDEDVRVEIMRGMDRPGLRQPTDEELFGHMVVPQEAIDAAEKSFETKLADFYAAASKPLTGQTEVPDEEWGTCKSFNSMLPKEELAKRNMFLGDE